MNHGDTPHPSRSAQIAALNDRLRKTGEGGRIVITAGVDALGAELVGRALATMRAGSAFPQEDDPYGEHDFGVVCVDRHILFWKIDYYDPSLTGHSGDPTDPTVTVRVLTVMLPEEYRPLPHHPFRSAAIRASALTNFSLTYAARGIEHH